MNVPNIKFDGNVSIGSRADNLRTGHDEANRRLSCLGEWAYKLVRPCSLEERLLGVERTI